MDATDKRALGPTFRRRLVELIERSGLSKTAFAERVGVDRSALSQLLSTKEPRLPRAETLAAMAQAQSVSLDWLLGLSEDDALATEVAAEVEIEAPAPGEVQARLLEWRREALGGKIRYVPSHLPDLVRLPEITALETPPPPPEARMTVDLPSRETRIDAKLEIDRSALAISRDAETDMEICMPRQRLELVAVGDGVYRGMSADLRRRQLAHIADLLDELYPRLRLFLFDARTAFSAPYTVFGAHRAAVYIGDVYLVLNGRAQIAALTRHFDQLIRIAEVDARDAAALLGRMADGVRDES